MNWVTVVSTLLLLLWIARADSQAPLLGPGSSVSIGSGSGSVTLVDLNRDEHLDLVTSRRDIRLGDGRGRFVPIAGSPFDWGFTPSSIAFGDVNGDGVVDCALMSRDTNSEYVHLLLGNGDGRFSATAMPRHFANRASEFYKASLRLIDINADEKFDVVAANARRNTIEIFIGDGRGGLSPVRVVPLEAGHNVYTFALGDVDADGHLDLAVAMSPVSASQSGQLALLYGDGTGAFDRTIGAPVSVGAAPAVAAFEDLNGDRRLDVVLRHGEKNVVSVLFGEDGGAFSKPFSLTLDPQMSAFDLVVADANRDEKPDLVIAAVNSVAQPGDSAVAVFLGGNNAFVPAPGSPFRVAPGAFDLAVGDVDENGSLDVLTSSRAEDALTRCRVADPGP
jgi:hypothetical protein